MWIWKQFENDGVMENIFKFIRPSANLASVKKGERCVHQEL